MKDILVDSGTLEIKLELNFEALAECIAQFVVIEVKKKGFKDVKPYEVARTAVDLLRFVGESISMGAGEKENYNPVIARLIMDTALMVYFNPKQKTASELEDVCNYRMALEHAEEKEIKACSLL